MKMKLKLLFHIFCNIKKKTKRKSINVRVLLETSKLLFKSIEFILHVERIHTL